MKKEENEKLGNRFVKIWLTALIFVFLVIAQIIINPSLGDAFLDVSDGKLLYIPLVGLILTVYIQLKIAELIVDYLPTIYRLIKKRFN